MLIDLRSDVFAAPTDEMWAAMRAAEVGWAYFGQDPSVNRLEVLAADLLGKQAALFVPSCTTANLVALMTLAPRGSRVVMEAASHTATSEAPGLAYVAGIVPQPLVGEAELSRWTHSKGRSARSRAAQATAGRRCCAWRTPTTRPAAPSSRPSRPTSWPRWPVATGCGCTLTVPDCSTRRWRWTAGRATGRRRRYGRDQPEQGARGTVRGAAGGATGGGRRGPRAAASSRGRQHPPVGDPGGGRPGGADQRRRAAG